MADEGRPTFDLSSFSTFAFPPPIPTEPEGSPKLMRTQSAESHDQKSTSVPQRVENAEQASTANDDEALIDLTKFGPPDALTELEQSSPIPAVVFTIIEASVDTVRTQVKTEHELCRRGRDRRETEQVADKETLQHVQDEDQAQAKDDRKLDKGKGVEHPQALRVPTLQSSAASDRTADETPPFYTPSEGQSPSANNESDVGSEALTAVPTAVDNELSLRPTLLPKSSSTSSIPRRRDLIKAIFRKTSDGETRRQALRRSAGGLQLKARLKHAKQIWKGEPDVGSVSLAAFAFFSEHYGRERCTSKSSYILPTDRLDLVVNAFPASTNSQPTIWSECHATITADRASIDSSPIQSSPSQTGRPSAVSIPYLTKSASSTFRRNLRLCISESTESIQRQLHIDITVLSPIVECSSVWTTTSEIWHTVNRNAQRATSHASTVGIGPTPTRSNAPRTRT